MVVRDLMNKRVHTVGPDDTLRDVHGMMRLTRTRHVPVVLDGKLAGIVSDRDVSLAWCQGLDTPVWRIMRAHPFFVHPETPALEAADIMLQHRVGSLPVVDDDQVLVGILTETDFLQLLRRALVLQATVH